MAFISGGDTELVYMLDDASIMDKLYGYAGWNTVGLIGYDTGDEHERIYNLIFRFMEDWCY